MGVIQFQSSHAGHGVPLAPGYSVSKSEAPVRTDTLSRMLPTYTSAIV
jgi:hypothetical protein